MGLGYTEHIKRLNFFVMDVYEFFIEYGWEKVRGGKSPGGKCPGGNSPGGKNPGGKNPPVKNL